MTNSSERSVLPRLHCAARAAGILLDDDGSEPTRLHREWKPETSSADALELAALIGASVRYDKSRRLVFASVDAVEVQRPVDCSVLHATRLAVVDLAETLGAVATP